jgi:hypothetical protein
MLPSFDRETLEQVSQGILPYIPLQVVWMDEFVFKSRKSCGIAGPAAERRAAR